MLAGKGAPHGLQQGELAGRRGRGVIGHVVRHPGETVEGHDRSPVFRLQDEGRDGEVLVLVALAGLQRGGVGHARVPIACARPFHMPPLPRQTSSAD